jgi:hypothetical protein
MRVYAYGFVTAGGIGGFEWRTTMADAEVARSALASLGEEAHIVAVDVPDDAEITDWLDASPELWEPAPCL